MGNICKRNTFWFQTIFIDLMCISHCRQVDPWWPLAKLTVQFTKPPALRFPAVPWLWLAQFLRNGKMSIGCEWSCRQECSLETNLVQSGGFVNRAVPGLFHQPPALGLWLVPFQWHGKMSIGCEWETGGQNALQRAFRPLQLGKYHCVARNSNLAE